MMQDPVSEPCFQTWNKVLIVLATIAVILFIGTKKHTRLKKIKKTRKNEQICVVLHFLIDKLGSCYCISSLLHFCAVQKQQQWCDSRWILLKVHPRLKYKNKSDWNLWNNIFKTASGGGDQEAGVLCDVKLRKLVLWLISFCSSVNKLWELRGVAKQWYAPTVMLNRWSVNSCFLARCLYFQTTRNLLLDWDLAATRGEQSRGLRSGKENSTVDWTAHAKHCILDDKFKWSHVVCKVDSRTDERTPLSVPAQFVLVSAEHVVAHQFYLFLSLRLNTCAW